MTEQSKRGYEVGKHVYIPRCGNLDAGVARIQGVSQNGKRLIVMFDNGGLREIGIHEVA